MRLRLNKLALNSGGVSEPFSSDITNRWRMLESGDGTNIVLADSVGSMPLTPSVGQSLNFDGAADYAQSDDDPLYAIFNGETQMTAAVKVSVDWPGVPEQMTFLSSMYNSRPFALKVTTDGTGRLLFKVLLDHGAGQTAYRFYFNFLMVAGVMYDIIATFDCSEAGNVPRMYVDGVELTEAGTHPVIPSGLTLMVHATAGRGNTLLAAEDSSAIVFPLGGNLFSAVAARGIMSVETTTSLLNALDSTSAQALMDDPTNTVWYLLDQGSGTTTLDAGKHHGQTTVTLNSITATSWLNGGHLEEIPQKGLQGGDYTGGIGLTAIQTYDVADDTDPPSAISSANFPNVGDSGTTFTMECWIYKPNASAIDHSAFWSFSPSYGIVVGASLRAGGTSWVGTADTDLVFEADGASATSRGAFVAANFSGWIYTACVLNNGYGEIYIAQPGDTSLTKLVDAVTDTGSVNAVTDQRLVFGAMVGTASGNTKQNVEAGTRWEAAAAHSQVARTEAELLVRFNAQKARYL